jgi:hypothetical protein
VNSKSNEIDYKIYDDESKYGHVTHLKVSGALLAIGYSSGTILVINLDLKESTQDEANDKKTIFETVHNFKFHKSAVTFVLFANQNTQMYSGS